MKKSKPLGRPKKAKPPSPPKKPYNPTDSLPHDPVTGKVKAGPGRPKGSQSSIALQIKEALSDSFASIDIVKWLNRISKVDPTLYAQLCIRYIPAPAPEANANGDVEGQNKVNVNVQLVQPVQTRTDTLTINVPDPAKPE